MYLFTVESREDKYEIGTKLLYDVIGVAGEPRDRPDDKVVGYELVKSEFVD